MEYATLRPYLPSPVNALKAVFDYCTTDYANLSEVKKSNLRHNYNSAIVTLTNTAIAAAAYFTAVKVGLRYGIDLPKAACLLALAFPGAAQLGVAAYMTKTSLQEGFVKVISKEYAGAAKAVAIAAFSYYATTPKFDNFAHKYIYSWLKQ